MGVVMPLNITINIRKNKKFHSWVAIVGYAPSWIFGSHLEIVEFPTTIPKYFEITSSRFRTSIFVGCWFITIGLWGIYT
jgi:hypothetical protein